MTYYIGADIGTSSVKLLLIDDLGNACARQEEFYSLSMKHPGWIEIDPDEWFSATMKGLPRLLDGIDRQSVRGIGFTGQMHTAVFLDNNGALIRPAISWNDIRTADLIKPLREEISKYQELRHIDGILSTGSPAVNLLWLRKNEPDNFARLHKVLIGPDYLTYRFSGIYGTDYCEASTSSLFDIRGKKWSSRMCQIIGLSESVLPPVRASGQKTGCLLPEIAEQLRLSPKVQIIAGTGDNPATYLSSGQLSNSEPVISLGTSGVLIFSRNMVDDNAKGKPILFSTDDSLFTIIVQGVVQSVGSSYGWWVKNILKSDSFDDVNRTLDSTGPINKHLLFYPHLAGDKTIHADPLLKGAFIGIGADVTREEATRAIFEGIGFAFRQLMERMHAGKETRTIKVTGRMSGIGPFMQILADILNVRIEVSENIGAVQGIAMLTAQSCGSQDIFTYVEKHPSQARVFCPRKPFSDTYNEKYCIYTKIYDSLKQIYK